MFRYEDVPDPVCPPGGVLIDVKAVSIEGGDVLNRAGGEMPSKPHIVGYQCAGIVREVGDGVTDRQAGQAVVALMPFGSHASLVAVAAMQTWPVPDGAGPPAGGVRADRLRDGARLPVRVRAT